MRGVAAQGLLGGSSQTSGLHGYGANQTQFVGCIRSSNRSSIHNRSAVSIGNRVSTGARRPSSVIFRTLKLFVDMSLRSSSESSLSVEANTSSKYVEVSVKSPCVVCAGSDFCSISVTKNQVSRVPLFVLKTKIGTWLFSVSLVSVEGLVRKSPGVSWGNTDSSKLVFSLGRRQGKITFLSSALECQSPSGRYPCWGDRVLELV